MGIADWLKRRRAADRANRDQARARIVQVLAETRRPYARVTFERAASTLAPTASKLGGVPYVPVGVSPPTPLRFLAQIDLAEVPPLEPLPRSGLVQLWIADDDTYGLFDKHGRERSDGSRVLYYPTTDRPQAPEIRAGGAFGPLVDATERRMLFEAKTELVPIGDREWDRFLARHGDDPDLYLYEDGQIDFDDSSGHKIGGYCAFTQDDPRTLDEPMFLLLQLDSDEHPFWGDTGIAHWFVREADLGASDFSRVRYYWDCC